MTSPSDSESGVLLGSQKQTLRQGRPNRAPLVATQAFMRDPYSVRPTLTDVFIVHLSPGSDPLNSSSNRIQQVYPPKKETIMDKIDSPVSMDDLFPLAFDENEEGYMGTSFKIYIDDSADKEAKEICHCWSLDWRSIRIGEPLGASGGGVLKRPPAIKYFHQKEFVRRSGEFEQFTDRAKWPRGTGRDAANSKRDLLRNVLEGSPILAIGIAILISDYGGSERSVLMRQSISPRMPFEIALQETLNQCVKAVRKIDSKSDLVIISDKSTKASRYTEVFEGFTRKNPVSAQYLRGIMHLDDEKITGHGGRSLRRRD